VEPCPPDSIESSVGLSLAYQVGPDNKAKWPECESSDPGGRYPCGEPYYGLYKITIYPFLADSYIPMVYHNDEYVQCYFDSGGDPDAGDPSLMGTADADPGWELANACVEMNQASKGRRGMAGWASRRNGKWSSVETMGVVSIQNRLALKQDYEEGLSEFGVPAGSRRAVSGISWKETKLEVKQQFKEPNTKVMEYWVTAAPVLCAVIGIVVAILHAAFDFYEYKQDMRIHAHVEAHREQLKKSRSEEPVSAFDQMDANGDGVVCKDEFLDYADTDGDGVVSKKEFSRVLVPTPAALDKVEEISELNDSGFKTTQLPAQSLHVRSRPPSRNTYPMPSPRTTDVGEEKPALHAVPDACSPSPPPLPAKDEQ